MTIFLDFETRSEADLKKVGAWAYSEHPSTQVICACWAEDGGEVQEWTNPGVGGRDGGCPDDLLIAVRRGALIEAHNVAFEYSIWHNVCVGWPVVPLDRWRDTMAVACYYSMPAALENLCRALGIAGKNPDGGRLVTRYSKLHLGTARREIPPEDLDKFVLYCRTDVEREREVAGLLGELPDEELRVFQHDLATAARGMLIDGGGVASAQAVVDERAAELEEEFARLTGGLKPGQRDKVLALLARAPFCLELPNLRSDTIEGLLDEGRVNGEPVSPAAARRILEVRQQYSRASTKKLDAMMRQRGRDGRARFQTRYHGAVTGRNTGTGFQPLNLVRGYDNVEPAQLVRDVSYGNPRWLDCLYGDAMEAVGKATRHWIVAAEGSRIIAGDFASIEAVVNACLAGEEWKVEAFRQPDPRVYEMAAERIYKLPPGSVTKKSHPDERQDGKKCELAFGYQGALGAWRKFDKTDRHDDATVLRFVREWRELHPAIVSQWAGLEDAALEAVAYPKRVTGYGSVGFERVDGWLSMILPDNKRIWYWAPQITMAWPQWHQPMEREDCATLECDCRKRPQVTYMAQKEGQWRRVSTYGGKLTENAVQAASRQLLKPAELALEAAGYPVILSVYDEIVCEVPEDRGSVAEVKEIMETPAAEWCAAWPIKAEVWEGDRYKK